MKNESEKNTTKKETLVCLIFSNNRENVCPYCGQSFVTIKISVCVCGMQVDNIQYVKSSEKFAKYYYSYNGENSASTE